MNTLFQIHTANSHVGGAQRRHVLHCNAGFEDIKGNDITAFVEVSVCCGQYSYTKFLGCAAGHDPVELITEAELDIRRENATAHGDDYDVMLGKSVFVVEWSHKARWANNTCQETIDKFSALIALGIFSLPVTF